MAGERVSSDGLAALASAAYSEAIALDELLEDADQGRARAIKALARVVRDRLLVLDRECERLAEDQRVADAGEWLALSSPGR